MRQIILIMIVIVAVFMFSNNAQAADEWLACDPPAETISGYNVIFNGASAVFVPFQLSLSGNDSLLWNITGIDSATFEIQAINDQGRKSDFIPFVLNPKPKDASGFRTIEE